MIMHIPVIPQNGISVQIKLNYDAAMAACFFWANLAFPVQFFLFILFLAPRQLAWADIKPVLGPERSPTPNPESNELIWVTELFLPVLSIESGEITPFQQVITTLSVIIEASPPCWSGQSLHSLQRVITWAFSM
jgi:hypothetical protein